MEDRIATIFERVFKLENPNRDLTFTQLGGRSVEAMQLQIELRHEFDVKLDFRSLYELGSIKAIAGYLAYQGFEQ